MMVGELIALADPTVIAPHIRLPRPEVAQLQAQLLIERADKTEFVRTWRQDKVVVVSIGQKDDNLVAHRSSPISLKRQRFPLAIIRLNP